MKKKNREINIFNLSMLDMISGAMGAFLIIMIILLPYYNKDTVSVVDKLEQVEKELKSEKKENKELEDQNKYYQEENRKQENKNKNYQKVITKLRSKHYLIAIIHWSNKDDVDLHIKDPKGKHFFYSKKKFSNYPGELTEDIKVGPGIESWVTEKLYDGNYEFYIKNYSINDTLQTKVKIRVIADGKYIKKEVKLKKIENGNKALFKVIYKNNKIKIKEWDREWIGD